jgi:hypothetical protein
MSVKHNKLYYVYHCTRAQEWGSLWYNIHNSICENLNYEMEKKNKFLVTKIIKLVRTQTVTPNNETKFYPDLLIKPTLI